MQTSSDVWRRCCVADHISYFFFFQAEDGIRDVAVTGVQTCALPILGIDRDYDSLRQDLWIATDQAFKEAVDGYSRKQAYLNSLAQHNDRIDDFAKVQPVHLIEPLVTPDWSGRGWDQEARDASAALRAFSLL